MKRAWMGGVILLVSLAVGSTAAPAKTERELALEQTVQMLLQRVEQLEKKVEALSESGSQSAPEIEARLSQVEAAVEKKATSNTMNVSWKSGLNFATPDNRIQLKLSGRVHNDWFFGDVDNADAPDGVRFRRAWLTLSGQLYEDLKFKWQYDFSGDGKAKWKDVYAQYTGLEWATITIGQFKEPFSLEEMVSANALTFLERSPVVSLFAPARETGGMLSGNAFDGRVTWAVGAFRNSDNFGDGFDDEEDEDKAVDGDWDVATRLTAAPWYEDGGEKLLHLGLAGVHRDWGGDALRYRARGSYSRGPRLVDTGGFDVEDVNLFGAEAALVLGPLSLQSEYMFADVNTKDFGSEDFQGAYIQASYLLTGEHRPYKGGVFKDIKPLENFSLKDDAWGAWELAARYSWLDLEDDDLSGGKLSAFVVGLNWYLNPNARVMWNYVHSDVDDRAEGDPDNADLFLMRLQLNF